MVISFIMYLVKRIFIFIFILSLILSSCNRNNHYVFSSLESDFISDSVLNIIMGIDRDLINNFVNEITANDITLRENIDQIDLAIKQENLYFITVYGCFINGKMYTVENYNINNMSVEYIITIEIGYGISPLTSMNGNICEQIYREDLRKNEKSIGTIRVWKLNHLPGGDFKFVIFDKDDNIFYNSISIK